MRNILLIESMQEVERSNSEMKDKIIKCDRKHHRYKLRKQELLQIKMQLNGYDETVKLEDYNTISEDNKLMSLRVEELESQLKTQKKINTMMNDHLSKLKTDFESYQQNQTQIIEAHTPRRNWLEFEKSLEEDFPNFSNLTTTDQRMDALLVLISDMRDDIQKQSEKIKQQSDRICELESNHGPPPIVISDKLRADPNLSPAAAAALSHRGSMLV
ncbi:hypothetical protein AKO1_008004 [Acrasis kona]|uniref:Uncharacterized protein n=1 Tax=Acrasis kona TaxID=1008807 RepID=A0AAW2YQF1_9EUKA